VVCFTADVGQGDELEGLEAKALASGASQLIIHDLHEEFTQEHLFRMLRAGAVYERKYLLGTSIARPLIAKHQVEVAHQVGADAVAHGATGKGNDQVRFELTYTALDPRLRVIAPWREWDIRSREDAIAYADARGIPIKATLKSIYSRDGNMWHYPTKAGPEDPDGTDEPMFHLAFTGERPDQPEYVEIESRAAHRRRTAKLPGPSVLKLNELGRTVSAAESGREPTGYEIPGGHARDNPLAAHRELESLVLAQMLHS
jgi:argininosuccinate synthase